MQKAVAFSVIGFGLGLAVALALAVNPAGWRWPANLLSTLPVSSSPATPAPFLPPAAEEEREILHWRAPMDATFTSDRPGKSPMGMDLVPVYADEGGSLPPGMVRIDPAFVQRVGVRSEPAGRRDIAQTIRTVGTLAHNDRQIAWVNTKYDGWIENVAVNYLGETVEEGQVLFDIYSPQLVTTQMEYLQAVDYAERLDASEYPDIAARAHSLVEAARARLGYWDITAAQIATLERERTPRRTLSVVSPVTGVVVEKMDQALDGMYVTAGTNLYKMADLTTIWVDVEIFEHQVEAMRVGQRAHVELPYLPGASVHGIRALPVSALRRADTHDDGVDRAGEPRSDPAGRHVRQRDVRRSRRARRPRGAGRSGDPQRYAGCGGPRAGRRHVPGRRGHARPQR